MDSPLLLEVVIRHREPPVISEQVLTCILLLLVGLVVSVKRYFNGRKK